MSLRGKKVLIGVSGGIAAYKAAELVRLFVKAEAHVDVVMTANAAQFITPLTLQTLSGNPVLTDTFDLAAGAEIKHVSLADEADLVVLAPATANLIGKLANGIADDLVTSLMLVARCPVAVAPAMNVNMWEHPIVSANVSRLTQVLGYTIIEPDEGMLACGYEGKGKLADPSAIFEQAVALIAPQDMRGLKVLITAGPTREYLDPVRFVSNPSTGKMGLAIAEEAASRGAEVEVVLGPTSTPAPAGVKISAVVTAAEMHERAKAAFASADVFIATAAVADYAPLSPAGQKLKKTDGTIHIDFARTTDILKELGADKGNRTIVGFAAETERVVEYAQGKLESKNCDLVVANDVSEPGSGFGTDTNHVWLISKSGAEELPPLRKREVARRLVDALLRVRKQAAGVKGLERSGA